MTPPASIQAALLLLSSPRGHAFDPDDVCVGVWLPRETFDSLSRLTSRANLHFSRPDAKSFVLAYREIQHDRATDQWGEVVGGWIAADKWKAIAALARKAIDENNRFRATPLRTGRAKWIGEAYAA